MHGKRNPVIVGLVLAIGAALVFFAWPHSPAKGGGATVPATSSVAPAFTKANANLLTQSLSSTDKAVQAKALAPQISSGQWDASTVLPRGATLTIDPSSFTTDQNGLGYVNAAVNGSTTVNFVLTLVYADGQWRIITTTQK